MFVILIRTRNKTFKTMEYTSTNIEITTDGYEFTVLDQNGGIENVYFVDVYGESVSWYSNFISGIKHFNSEDEADSFAFNKINSLRKKAVHVEKNISLA